MMPNRRPYAVLLLCLTLLSACQQAPPSPATPLAHTTAVANPTLTPTHTATHTPTQTASPTTRPSATPTHTPTATPTPTATAVPLQLRLPALNPGNSPPVPQGDAVCGLVDTLDFPIDPPDAANVARGGSDFGVFRQRYDKFHAGEDWGAPNGLPNLGTPVYSIGHGLVTFAHPLGWNRDKGVVIVQHSFADGRSFYSFYGHLDPDSVLLTAGSCVQRGMLVGRIGQPRTPPHLHFEIREHMPYTPGPGYWPEDPTTVGWLPPSATIWQERLRTAPGVEWVRPFEQHNPQAVGLLEPETFVILEDGGLVGLNLANGRVRWRYRLADEQPIEAAVLPAGEATVYLRDSSGQLTAVGLPLLDQPLAFPVLWQIESPLVGHGRLFPLPGGGLLLNVRQYAVALSAAGEPLWQHQFEARPLSWHSSPTDLLLAIEGDPGGVWRLSADGVSLWADRAGQPFVAGQQGWLYGREGLYRVEEGTAVAQLLLPTAQWNSAAMAATMAPLPDGGLLLAHVDAHGRRLLAFAADGSLMWDRSVAGLIEGTVYLVASADGVYLLAEQLTNGVSQIDLYALDWQTAVLTRILRAGSRHSQTPLHWTAVVDANALLLNMGGGQLIRFAPLQAAAEIEP